MQIPLQTALSALETVTGFRPIATGNEYKARCPVHEADGGNHTPSLSVRQGDRQDLLLHCHVGCSFDAIVAALGLKEPAHQKPNKRIVATYAYCDENGALAFEKVRYQPKEFRIRHRSAQGGDWIWKKPTLPTYPLYRLPDVLAAKASGRPIFVVEGEKDVDRAANVGLIATTNVEGASEPGKKPKWRKEYTAQLAGAAQVVLIPDHDAPGRAHMAHIAQQLRGKVVDLRWLELPDLPLKGDLSDFLLKHTAEELLALAAQAPAPSDPAKTRASDPAQAPAPEPDSEATTPGLPPGFRLTDTALEHRGKMQVTDPETGETTTQSAWQPIAGPLRVVAHGRDAESGGWALVCEFPDYEGKPHVEVLPREALAEPTPLRAALLRAGLHLEPGNAAKNALVTYLHRVKPDRFVRLIDRPGWHSPAYVLPDATFGDPEEALLLRELPRLNPYQVRGDVTAWQTHIGRLCVGNSRLILAVCTALAAPLLTPLGLESGGIHFRFASSGGKTTALAVAASVCGDPRRGRFMESWSSTKNGLEGLAASRHDSLLLLDEIGQLDGREAGDAAYLLSNEIGKQRAERDGSAARRRTWKLLFLSTGELSLAEHMRAAGKRARAGQEIRLIELPAADAAAAGLFEELHDHPNGDSFSNALLKATAQWHGAPLRAWLAALTQTLDPLLEELRESIALFKHEHTPPKADGQVHRGVRRLALLAAAGELATRLGITGWTAGAAWDASVSGLQSWLQDRGGPGAREDLEALAQVRKFLELHGESRFAPWHCPEHHAIPNRAGFRKADDQGDGERFYIFPETFKAEVCAGLDWKRAARVMIERGWLVASAEGKSSRFERLPSIGGSRCFVLIGSQVFGDSDSY